MSDRMWLIQVVLAREGIEPVGCWWEGLFFLEGLTLKMKPL